MKARSSIVFLVILLAVCAVSANAQTTIRVNCGPYASAFTDSNGHVWSTDTGFTGGYAYTNGHAISNTVDDVLYTNLRYANFSYTFAVPNGDYIVNLLFAETVFNTAGARVFGMSLNGQTVLSNFDIYAKVGEYVPDIESFPITVTNGSIVIQAIPSVQNPILNAIEIVPNVAAIGVLVSPSNSTIPIGQTGTFTATVSNDPANAGVNWTASSGSVSPASTASGAQTTYTAPQFVPANQVILTATSVTDPTKSGSATITVPHQIALSWQASTTAGVTYRVYRAPTPTCTNNFNQIAANLTNLSFTDTTMLQGQGYCFKVTAFDGTVESDAISIATVTVQ